MKEPRKLSKRRVRFSSLHLGDMFYHKFTDNFYQKIDSKHGQLLDNDISPVYVVRDFMLVYKVIK